MTSRVRTLAAVMPPMNGSSADALPVASAWAVHCVGQGEIGRRLRLSERPERSSPTLRCTISVTRTAEQAKQWPRPWAGCRTRRRETATCSTKRARNGVKACPCPATGCTNAREIAGLTPTTVTGAMTWFEGSRGRWAGNLHRCQLNDGDPRQEPSAVLLRRCRWGKPGTAP